MKTKENMTKLALTSGSATALELIRLAIRWGTCAANPDYSVHLGECNMKVLYSLGVDCSRLQPEGKDWVIDNVLVDEEDIETCEVSVFGEFCLYSPALTNWVGGTYSAKVRLVRKRWPKGPWRLDYVAYTLPSHGVPDRPQADIYIGHRILPEMLASLKQETGNPLGIFPKMSFVVRLRNAHGSDSPECEELLRYLAITQGQAWSDPTSVAESAPTVETVEIPRPAAVVWWKPATWPIFRRIA